VLHRCCVQAERDAPTVVGGAGTRLTLLDARLTHHFPAPAPVPTA
jgi:hypothetical protein